MLKICLLTKKKPFSQTPVLAETAAQAEKELKNKMAKS